jgi:hypothetical protein
VHPVLFPVNKLEKDGYCEPRGSADMPDKSLSFLRSIWHDEKLI